MITVLPDNLSFDRAAQLFLDPENVTTARMAEKQLTENLARKTGDESANP